MSYVHVTVYCHVCGGQRSTSIFWEPSILIAGTGSHYIVLAGLSSLCRPGWPQTQRSAVSTSGWLDLKACTTIPGFPSWFFETVSYWCLGCTNFTRQTGQGAPMIFTYPPPQSWYYRCESECLACLNGCWDLNTGPHPCMAKHFAYGTIWPASFFVCLFVWEWVITTM